MRSTTSLVDQPCKDGSIVSTEAVTTLLVDEQGQVSEILGVSRDITDAPAGGGSPAQERGQPGRSPAPGRHGQLGIRPGDGHVRVV